MGWRHYSDLIVVGFIGVVGTFTMLYAEELVFHYSAWCIEGEEHCVRDWIGATAGWVAALVAGVTGYFIWGQMRESRRQTEFMIGESNPTVAIVEDEVILDPGEAFQNVLEITNWNRNPIVVRCILVDDESGIELLEVSVQGEDQTLKNIQQSLFERGTLTLPGWTNRADAPPAFRFHVMFGKRENPIEGYGNREFVRVAVDVVILEAEPRHVRLVGATPVAVVL